MKQIVMTVILAASAIGLAASLIVFPEESLDASLRGLNTWWEIVFPSLLPFFITAELLIGFGVVQFIGILFEPLMRPLFNVPGAGGFAWVMGMASGYPSGAKISTRLRQEDQLTKTEAERLVSFTNASSPLFIFGAIAVGLFEDTQLGLLLALAHYGGNTLVGLCMRFYKHRETKIATKQGSSRFSIKKAFQNMHQTRVNDSRPIGEIIGDAVLNSIQTLVMVGGFIILFSVLTKLMHLINITSIAAVFVKYLFHLLSLPAELSLPFITGLFEITLGSQLVSETASGTLMAKMIVISFMVGFNGFSIQAQVASILAKTDIAFKPYFIARIIHGVFAAILIVILYKPVYVNGNSPVSVPVFQNTVTDTSETLLEWMAGFGPLITLSSLAAALIILTRKHFKESSKG